jgi:hypothetical protein
VLPVLTAELTAQVAPGNETIQLGGFGCSSQPSSTAMSGMPTRIHSRFATGMLVGRDAVDQHLAAGRLL